MAPRTILHTGKGGAGTTSVAAATARACAARGQRTLLISTGPEHALSGALGVAVAAEPTAVAPGLWAQEVSARAERERLGVTQADLDDLLRLLALGRQRDTGAWDVLVVDCAPAATTLGLLGRADAARARAWAEDATRGRSEGAGAALRVAQELVALGEHLRDRDACTARLVTAPDRAAPAAVRNAATRLDLHGVLLDAVVVDRLLPAEVDGYLGDWRERQQEHLAAIERGVAPVPVLRAPHFEREVAGPAMLDRLGAALFGDGGDPAAVLHTRDAGELVLGRAGATLRLPLAFATRAELRLTRIGGTLIVGVGDDERHLSLPSALADYRASGARFKDGSLHVTFDPPA